MTAGGSSTPASSAAGAVTRKSNPGSPWTDQETAHLIDAYEERWYSLKRGQLKAQQWEEVAAEVAARCGFTIPSKNGTQCRHKIEKLRKRYRTERLRPVKSSWPFFDRIDRMERGPVPISALPASSDEDEYSGEPHGNNTRSINGILREAAPWENSRVSRNPGKRKRLPEKEKEEEEEEEEDDDDDKEVEDGGDVREIAAELRRFGEHYVRMERRRMDVMREMEREWMEMEAKRMEMIMEAQRGLMDTIAETFSKKAKNSVDM